ncbi:hypothetical protein ACP4OV_028076 [Aristida adscensionis]
MVLVVLGSVFYVSSIEPVQGLRMLQGNKATPTSDARTQTIHTTDESEFVHTGAMGFMLNDYPASGANSRHSSYPGGTR